MTHSHHHQDNNPIRWAFFINLIFTIIEIIGGLFTNSLAILSDALHDLGDSLALGLAWYLQKVSRKKSDEKFTYGYQRFSLLGALISSVILLTGSVLIVVRAIPRLLEPEMADAKGMIWLAVLGVVMNGLAVVRLRGDHSYNERVVRLHLLEDVLGWIAVLIGAVIMHYTGWYLIDPLLSLLIAIYIIYQAIKNLRSTTRVILQGTPHHLDLSEIESEITKVSGVGGIHDLHLWSLDGQHAILTAHIVVQSGKDQLQIKQDIKKAMRKNNIVHCTLELEGESDACDDHLM